MIYNVAQTQPIKKTTSTSMPKIIRDIAILIAFCGAFLLLIFFVRGESTKAATSSNFSTDRLEGDRMLRDEKWEQAIVHFSRLVEKDKYNGLAQMSLSKAAFSKLYEEGIAFTKKSEAGEYSEDAKKEISVQLRAQAIECIEIHNKLLRFERYEAEGYRNLAALNCFIGDEDEAMKFLERYVRSNSYHGGNIQFDPKLSSLWEREDFKKLIEPKPEFQGERRGFRDGRRFHEGRGFHDRGGFLDRRSPL